MIILTMFLDLGNEPLSILNMEYTLDGEDRLTKRS